VTIFHQPVDVATIGTAYTLIPDLNFEKKLIALELRFRYSIGKVLTSNKGCNITPLDANIIADLTV
jgi:hypothetical protein